MNRYQQHYQTQLAAGLLNIRYAIRIRYNSYKFNRENGRKIIKSKKRET